MSEYSLLYSIKTAFWEASLCWDPLFAGILSLGSCVHAYGGGWMNAHATFYGGGDASGTMGYATSHPELDLVLPSLTGAAHLSGQLESSKIAESEQSSMNVVSELTMKIHQLSSATRNARRGNQKKRVKKTQELKQEAKTAQAKAEEAEKKLEIILKDAEEAKATQKRALEEMKMQGGTDVAKSTHSGKIKLSVEEFEVLNRKSEECKDLVKKVEAAAIALVKEIDAKKNEPNKKVEANLKATKEIETATDIALKNAEMGESAKLMAKGELRRWRQQEHKVASEASS